jgi:hypothetical protein
MVGGSHLVITDERERVNRYYAYVANRRVGRVSAIPLLDTVLIPHVEVGRGGHDLGIGSLLVRRVLDDARSEGHSVLALCPFARRWVDLHPGYRDVARKPAAGEVAAVAALVAADRTMCLLRGDLDAIPDGFRPRGGPFA